VKDQNTKKLKTSLCRHSVSLLGSRLSCICAGIVIAWACIVGTVCTRASPFYGADLSFARLERDSISPRQTELGVNFYSSSVVSRGQVEHSSSVVCADANVNKIGMLHIAAVERVDVVVPEGVSQKENRVSE
jgi:hypothetical protein